MYLFSTSPLYVISSPLKNTLINSFYMFSCPNVYYISHSTKMSRGGLFAGAFCLAVCIYVWVVIAFFLTKNQFNPIQDALDDFFPNLEVFLQQNATFQGANFNATAGDVTNYVENIRAFCPYVITATLVISLVYALSTILMMIATEFQLSRALMIPYMVLHLFFIIIMLKINFFQNLTLALMSQFSSTFFLVFFILTYVLSISIVLASMFLIYYMNKIWTDGDNYFLVAFSSCYVALGCSLVTFLLATFYGPMGFSRAYFSVVLNSIVSLYFPFVVCLLFVWKLFVEMEPENNR